MKTIELSTGTLLVVAADLAIIKGDLSGFQLLGHPSEITGEVWGKVVEYVVEQPEYIGDWSRTLHKDYVTKVYKYWNALPSGLSLIAAHNIQESDVLLFKPKNK